MKSASYVIPRGLHKRSCRMACSGTLGLRTLLHKLGVWDDPGIAMAEAFRAQFARAKVGARYRTAIIK